MSMLLYIDYFVQNVYQACAYIEISFTANMIQYNLDVNVLNSNYSCLIFYFIFSSSPDSDKYHKVVRQQIKHNL